MIFETNLPSPIPASFYMPSRTLLPLQHGESLFFLAQASSQDHHRQMPCSHCGVHPPLVGAFPLTKGLGFLLWQCPECLHYPRGSHAIEVVSIDTLKAESPHIVKAWLSVDRGWSLPGMHHRHQNPWLNKWIEDGGFVSSRSPIPGVIQIGGWSSSLYCALDPCVNKKPRSSSLMLQLDSENIDTEHHGLLKYYYCHVIKKTVLDYEYSEKAITGSRS